MLIKLIFLNKFCILILSYCSTWPRCYYFVKQLIFTGHILEDLFKISYFVFSNRIFHKTIIIMFPVPQLPVKKLKVQIWQSNHTDFQILELPFKTCPASLNRHFLQWQLSRNFHLPQELKISDDLRNQSKKSNASSYLTSKIALVTQIRGAPRHLCDALKKIEQSFVGKYLRL